MATPDCVVETRGGTATVCSGSDAYNHEDLFYASTPSESGKKKEMELHQALMPQRRGGSEMHSQDSQASTRALCKNIHEALHHKIQELEEVEAGERDAAKTRKKVLREVQKFVVSKDKSIQEKLEFLHKKIVEQVTQQGSLEKDLAALQKQSDKITSERDTAQTNLKKSNVMNDKLQELCRTLQKQSREVLEESKQRAQHEADQRKALSDKMEATVKDVSARLDHQTSKHIEENTSLRDRLESLMKFCEDLDKGHKSQLARKDEEISLIDQQLKEQCSIAKHEGDRANLFKEQCEAVQRSHDELQEELATVKDQLFDFQGTIKTSNKMFNQLRSEIKISKKTHDTLKKENDMLKVKCARSDEIVQGFHKDVQATTQQSEELKKALAALRPEHTKLKAQKDSLENLCRALQKEVQSLRTKLAESSG